MIFIKSVRWSVIDYQMALIMVLCHRYCHLEIKALTVSGTEKFLDSDLMGDKVLGYIYNVETDMLGLHFGMNVSKKKRSVRIDPDLTVVDLEKLR